MIEAMQQTDKYKLNKPGIDDPISPQPLNENAEKIEAALNVLNGAIAATDARHCIDKLMGPLTVAEGVTELTVDLSSIDMSQYGALILAYSLDQVKNGSTMYWGEETALKILVGGGGGFATRVSGGGFAFLFPANGEVYIFVLSCQSAEYRTHKPGDWNALPPLRFAEFKDKSVMSVFGLRF